AEDAIRYRNVTAVQTCALPIPNTEFGHIEIHGKDAEERASERARELHDLSWGKWAGRVDDYLTHVEALVSPSLFIIGGGISRKSARKGVVYGKAWYIVGYVGSG